jgi:hypothetical protein
LIFIVSPLTTQYYGIRAKTCWFVIRIMCLNGSTCLTIDSWTVVSAKDIIPRWQKSSELFIEKKMLALKD